MFTCVLGWIFDPCYIIINLMVFRYFSIIDSTNSYVRRLYDLGNEEDLTCFKDGLVVVADQQSSGRGCRNKTWCSDEGGIYYSYAKFLHGVDLNEQRFSVLVGGYIADIIADVSGLDPVLKWPNDVLIADKKVSGVLIEQLAPKHGCQGLCIVGIGLNLNQETFPDELSCRATSLRKELGVIFEKELFYRRFTEVLQQCF